MKSIYVAPLLLLGFVACGDDGDALTAVVDAARIDAAIDAPAVCTVGPTFSDRGALVPSLCIEDERDPKDPADSVIVLRAPLEAGSPFDELELQLWSGYGVFTNGFAPGKYAISGDELQFFTCGLCAFINSDRVDDNNYTDDYFATGGTIELTSVAGRMTGTLTNVKFEHVSIVDSMTAPIGDGCESEVVAGTFDAAITPPPMMAKAHQAPRAKRSFRRQR